jgi:hypothetical protein
MEPVEFDNVTPEKPIDKASATVNIANPELSEERLVFIA